MDICMRECISSHILKPNFLSRGIVESRPGVVLLPIRRKAAQSTLMHMLK
jgi:hypothetical protein